MLISYHWLKKFIKSLKQSPQEVADKITLNLVEVESLTKKKGGDTILEIENKGITNRPDCFSQLGLAREVAAYFNLKLNDPLEKLTKLKFNSAKKNPFTVKVLEPSLCYRYSSIVLTDIKVKPSPKWLKTGVENCGVRSINNVVDITNYVMLELGQPLHAFDYKKLRGKKIIVRKAKKNEAIETLDKEKRKLNEKVLVIADAKDPVGIAGIIGGVKSEITEKTKTIVLESANFDKLNNRQSEKFLKLRTEASTRFEKGLDINLTLPTLNRAVELLQKVASAKVASQTIDVQNKKVKPWKIKTSPQWINKFLGLKLTAPEMIKILNRLNLKPQTLNLKPQITITIPTYRSDLNMPADIAEEIARIYGYDNIPITPLRHADTLPKPNLIVDLRKRAKLFFQTAGFTETLTPPFLGKDILETFYFDPKNHLKLINPLTIDQKYLRQSLIPSLMLVAKKNLRFFNQLKSFEIDRIFIPQGKNQPKEIINLAALVVSKNSYFQLKGATESLFENFGIKVMFAPLTKNSSFWESNQTAQITASKEILGKIGKIKQTILNKLEIKEKVSALEIDFSKIVKNANLTKLYQPIPKYPPIIEHLTFTNKNQVLAANILKIAKNTHKLVKKVQVIDTFKNRISLEITYQSKKRSLTDKEVAKICKTIVKNLEKLGLKLRGTLSS